MSYFLVGLVSRVLVVRVGIHLTDLSWQQRILLNKPVVLGRSKIDLSNSASMGRLWKSHLQTVFLDFLGRVKKIFTLIFQLKNPVVMR